MAKALQRLAKRAGYHVARTPPNRFDAMDDVVAALARRGLRPALVVDAGANVGAWTAMARAIFPDAEFHLIEPQPACQPALAELSRLDSRVHIHPVALTRPGVSEVTMIGGGTTGAWIAGAAGAGADAMRVPASTLDDLLARRMPPNAGALMKLDVEGHELEALGGAADVLRSVEAIVTEVHFFDIERSGQPVFADIVAFLRARDFELYEIVALGSRRRDGRLRMGDAAFVRRGSDLLADARWE